MSKTASVFGATNDFNTIPKLFGLKFLAQKGQSYSVMISSIVIYYITFIIFTNWIELLILKSSNNFVILFPVSWTYAWMYVCSLFRNGWTNYMSLS